MTRGWIKTTLGEICDRGQARIQTGPFGSQLHSHDYQPVGVPVVPTEGIGRRRLRNNVIPRVSEAVADRLSRHKLQIGDILFARRGAQATGLSALVEPKQAGWLCGTGAILLRIETPDIDSTFLSFVLSSDGAISWLKSHAVGAVMPNLNEGVLRRLPLCLPALPEQQFIASVLGALDDKIEMNRLMIETLEEMAQTTFKSWFLDTSTKLPKGVQKSQLGEHVEVIKGLSYKGSGLADEGVPLHNLNSIYEGGRYKHEGLKHYTGEYRDRHICLPGDVIVANTEQGHEYLLIGYPAIIPKHYGNFGLFTHHVYRVRPLPGSLLTNHFIYLLLLTTSVREQVIGHTNGTTVNALAKSGIEQAAFALPPAERIAEFERIVAPMFDQQEILFEESRTLAELRDALLPKLLSGELRVPVK